MKAGFAYRYVEIHVNGVTAPAIHGTQIEEYMKERERDPKRAAALARARQRLAAKLDDAPQFSLTALRLSKGISQAKLAELMETQQPSIARMERGDDVLLSTMEKLAKALDVPLNVVCEAVQATRAAKLESKKSNV